jgi:hypothetical protein
MLAVRNAQSTGFAKNEKRMSAAAVLTRPRRTIITRPQVTPPSRIRHPRRHQTQSPHPRLISPQVAATLAGREHRATSHRAGNNVTITTKFAISEFVKIDKDSSIKAVVVGILIRAMGIQYEVAWFNGGTHASAYIDEFRLTPFNEE